VSARPLRVLLPCAFSGVVCVLRGLPATVSRRQLNRMLTQYVCTGGMSSAAATATQGRARWAGRAGGGSGPSHQQ
jgi:hypothetical protein